MTVPDDTRMDLVLLEKARAAKGFMPDNEGDALYRWAVDAARRGIGPLVEIGAYCGKSTLYLGAAALHEAQTLFSVDHHHGSEENQLGWEHHDASLVDPRTGRLDTLPAWRRTVAGAGLEDCVVAVVGDSPTVAHWWRTPACFVFIDGGHGAEPAWADYRGWAPHVAPGGLLAIHDVFPNPADGGRPPFEIYTDALTSGGFAEVCAEGSLRVLENRA